MNFTKLDEHLRTLNAAEQTQKEVQHNINDLNGEELVMETGKPYPKMREELFLERTPIYIRKHNRFAPMPAHTHAFIEINYMYSGSGSQRINNLEVHLEAGEVCMLDTEVPHSIESLGDNDILVNILIKKEAFISSLLGRLSDEGIVSSFLVRALSENQQHDQYIIFRSAENETLQWMMKKMMEEFFYPKAHSATILPNYLAIVFTELMRTYQVEKNDDYSLTHEKLNIIQVLKYIENHFHTCSLDTTAAAFNVNPNYLSNILKSETGSTFVDLVQQQRMKYAERALLNENGNIEDIAFNCGYESVSYFYKVFRTYFQTTPSKYRKAAEQF